MAAVLIVSVSVLETARLANLRPIIYMKVAVINSVLIKKAQLSAFFYAACCSLLWLFIGSSSALLAVEQTVNPAFCSAASTQEHAQVYRIIDGDTLVLDDKRRVRILGINTPEINHKHAHLSQPGAIEARTRLTQLLKDKEQIKLLFDDKRQDRYKRLLARVINAQGVDVGEQLVKEGFARQYLIMPNQRCWQRYRQAEQQARVKQLGIWSIASYQAVAAEQLDLASHNRQFMRISGTITELKHSNNNLWFVLDDKLYLGISRKHLDSFKQSSNGMDQLALDKLKLGELIEVSGFVYVSHGKLRLKITHPQALYVY